MPSLSIATLSSLILDARSRDGFIDAYLREQLKELKDGVDPLCQLHFLGNGAHEEVLNGLIKELLQTSPRDIRNEAVRRQRELAADDVRFDVEAAGKERPSVPPIRMSGSSAQSALQSFDLRNAPEVSETGLRAPSTLTFDESSLHDASEAAELIWLRDFEEDHESLTVELRRQLYQLQRTSCPLDFEHERDATQAMVDGATAVDEEGNEVDIPEGLLKVGECEWETKKFPVAYLDLNVLADRNDPRIEEVACLTRRIPLYFHSGYVFHPGSDPIDQIKKPLGMGSRSSATVHVVDTGWPNRDYNPHPAASSPPKLGGAGSPITKSHPTADIDPHHSNNQEVVRGHGPAIVDVVNRLAPGAAQLTQVRYFEGWFQGLASSGQLSKAALLLPTPDGTGRLVRSFDERALTETLDRLDLEQGDVVNLSLGCVACPSDMGADDPVRGWIETTAATKRVQVVVAAGNHGTDVSKSDPPSFPAAYADVPVQHPELASVGPPLAHVISVGSAKDASGTGKHDFSAKGAWVAEWENGKDVPVKHPLFNKPGSPSDATWTGTSFAAPRHAASIV